MNWDGTVAVAHRSANAVELPALQVGMIKATTTTTRAQNWRLRASARKHAISIVDTTLVDSSEHHPDGGRESLEVPHLDRRLAPMCSSRRCDPRLIESKLTHVRVSRRPSSRADWMYRRRSLRAG